MMTGRAHSPNVRDCKLIQFLTVALCVALCTGLAAAQKGIEELPSAPEPQLEAETSRPVGFQFRSPDDLVPLGQCPYDQTGARECRVHWHQLVISTSLFIAFLNAGNLYSGYWYRWETTHGKWFDRWINSAADWQWNRWSDSNPVLDDYVGHPMMGAITNYLWIQNDPKSMTLAQSNTWPYWRRMLRATAFSTVVHFEWKFGPFGEAGIGHNGDHIQFQASGPTYGTGDVELVTTPVVGGLWTMGEDALDEHVITHLEHESRNPFALLGYQFLNPARATANILRFRPPWYRDTRTVKADSFWSDPPGESVTDSTAEAEAAEAPVQRASKPRLLPVWPRPGGVHEFGAWWGLSLISGHVWGFANDVKYMPIDVRYSYLFSLHRHWALRYSPEVTALAMLDEPLPLSDQTDRFHQRKRTYGSGISPVGFQADFLPSHRVQPFVSTNGGGIYFYNRVLSPEGSRFMYTIDFGCGINIFRKARQAVTIGYRYQHLSNANISLHNPGTDANTFYVGVSRFRTKGFR
jgi:hypothetical protein